MKRVSIPLSRDEVISIYRIAKIGKDVRGMVRHPNIVWPDKNKLDAIQKRFLRQIKKMRAGTFGDEL